MVQPIQNTYSYHQQIGQVGEIARPSAPFDIDRGVAGVELRPGESVYYDAGNNNWIKSVSAATRKLATHVVSFNKNAYNTAIGAPSANNLTEVVYAIGDMMPLIEFGSVFVVAGETVESQDSAIYNESTGKWIKYTPSPATADDLRKKAFKFYVDPGKTVADEGIVEVKVPSNNYSFAALDSTTTDDLQTEIDAIETGAGLDTDGTYISPSGTNYIDAATSLANADVLLDTQLKVVADLEPTTAKITITAAEVKALKATPIELVAAQGADTFIEFISAVLVLKYGSEVFTESADNLAIEYDDGSGLAIVPTIEATGFIDQAADTLTNAIPVLDSIAANAAVLNKNIAILNNNDEFAGNASNDSVLEVHVTYRVLDLS